MTDRKQTCLPLSYLCMVNLQLRCPHCKQWNEPENSIPGNCVHCGKPLKEITPEEQKSIERRKQAGEFIHKLKINPDDAFPLKAAKYGFNILQLVYWGIVSFFLWLIALGPG